MDFSKLPADILPLLFTKLIGDRCVRLHSLRALLQCSKRLHQHLRPCAKFVNTKALVAGLNGHWQPSYHNDYEFNHWYYVLSGDLEGVVQRHQETYSYGPTQGWRITRRQDKQYEVVPCLDQRGVLTCQVQFHEIPEVDYASENGQDYSFFRVEDREILSSNLFDLEIEQLHFTFRRYKRVSAEEWKTQMESLKCEPQHLLMCGIDADASDVVAEDGCCYSSVVECYDKLVATQEIVKHGEFPRVVQDQEVKNQICRKISLYCMKEKSSVADVNVAILSELYLRVGRRENGSIECDH